MFILKIKERGRMIPYKGNDVRTPCELSISQTEINFYRTLLAQQGGSNFTITTISETHQVPIKIVNKKTSVAFLDNIKKEIQALEDSIVENMPILEKMTINAKIDELKENLK